MKYFTFHIGDYLTATTDLSPMEELLYFKLLLKYYAQESALMRTQCERIANALRLTSTKELDYILETFFFTDESGLYHNKRADIEIAKSQEKSEKARKSALSRSKSSYGFDHTASKSHSERNANAQRTQNERIANDMLSNIQHPTSNIDIESVCSTSAIKRPDDLPVAEWAEYLRMVRQKTNYGGLNSVMWNKNVTEAQKANITVAEAVHICLEKNWKTFNAEYWQNSKEIYRKNNEPEPIDYEEVARSLASGRPVIDFGLDKE